GNRRRRRAGCEQPENRQRGARRTEASLCHENGRQCCQTDKGHTQVWHFGCALMASRSAVNHLSYRDLLQPVADLWQQLLTYGQRDSDYALVPLVIIPEFSPRLADWRPAPV